MPDRGRFAISPATAGLNHAIFAEETAISHWPAGLIAAGGPVSRDLRRWSLAQSGTNLSAVCKWKAAA